MSLHGVYDSQNIFAKIIRGEAPCYKVYEDETCSPSSICSRSPTGIPW